MIPSVKEACKVDGTGLGETTGGVQQIYMPQGILVSASAIIIRCQDDLTTSDDPSFDSDLYNFGWGDTEDVMTLQPKSGLKIDLNAINKKLAAGQSLGYVKPLSEKRMILVFLP